MKNFGYKGFSLIEILVVIGLASGFSIALLKMTQEQAVVQSITNGLALNEIKNRKAITIYDISSKYGSNSIKLQCIVHANLTLNLKVANRNYGEVKIVTLNS